MASLSVGIAAIVVHATGFIPLLPYCDLHLWPWLPSHMLWDWELVGLYAIQVLNAPLQWPKIAKWLLPTAPVLGWFRLVSARREEGWWSGGWGFRVWSCGWTDWPLEKVSCKAWEERSCLNGSFLSLFSPWPGLRLCMVIYECVGEREGLQRNPPAVFVARVGLGRGACHWFGSVIYTCTHTSAHTLFRIPPRTARTEERTLLRGRFGKWGVLHTIAVSSLIYASQAYKPHKTS